MNDNELERLIQNAVKNLSTVRRPVPKVLDEKSLNEDIEKVEPLFDLTTQGIRSHEDKEMVVDTLVMIIGLQRKVFNRSLWQITVKSLVDELIYVIKFSCTNLDEHGFIAALMIQLVIYIEDKKLALDATNMMSRFVNEVEAKNPKLQSRMLAIAMENIDNAAEYTRNYAGDDFFDDSDERFSSNPVVLFNENESDFFIQYGNIDFNEIINQIYQKHNKIQLLIAYMFFESHHNGAMDILLYAQNQKFNKYDLFEAQNFEFMLKKVKNLNLNGVINFSKVFHQLLKFYQDRGVISAKEYRKVLQEGNHIILMELIGDSEISDIDIDQLEKEVFSKPNHTINSKAAEKYLSKFNWRTNTKETVVQSIYFMGEFVGKLVVSKKLDDHQLELELKKVHQELENLWITHAGIDTQVEYEKYEEFILQIHKDMVQKYNRRVRRWTMESLIDCLENFFKKHPEAYEYPGFIRFFEAYLYQLDEDGAISSLYNLSKALDIISFHYLIWGVNWLGK